MEGHQLDHGKVRLAPHKCDECGSTFTQAGSVKKHQLSVHRGVTRFKCPTCDYVTFHKSNFRNHLLVHTGETPYKCSICDYACKNSDRMKKHQTVHSKVRPHKCDGCELTFALAGNLRAHKLSVHKGVTRFKCSTCDYVCFYKSGLKRHLLVHTMETPYKCSICDYACKNAESMKRHQSVHSKVRLKLHKCDECESTFTRATHLRTHELAVHRGVTRFKCSICDFVTFYKTTFKKHLRTHSVQNLHSCIDCHYYTKALSALQKHLLQHIVTH